MCLGGIVVERSSNTAERLRAILSQRGLRQVDLAKMTGITAAGISQYCNGVREPNQEKLYILGKALSVSPVWLMGFDVPMRSDIVVEAKNVDKIKIPLLGNVACGEPIYASEELELYVEVGANLKVDYCLRAKGDSMINARIHDGDIVFVQKCSMVENGELAVVVIDDEATLKRVYYDREKQKLVLQAENPRYAPLVYVGEELEYIHIIGKAVAFQSDVK